MRQIERDLGGRIYRIDLPRLPTASQQTFELCHDLEDNLVSLETPEGRSVQVERDELGRPYHTVARGSLGSIESQSYSVLRWPPNSWSEV